MRKATEWIEMLILIKVAHTAVWALVAGAIVALPFLAWRGAFGWAAVCSALALAECALLLANGRRCPMTDWAARYTSDRSLNFDIYIPRWLARWNAAIFGALFLINEGFVVIAWLRRRP